MFLQLGAAAIRAWRAAGLQRIRASAGWTLRSCCCRTQATWSDEAWSGWGRWLKHPCEQEQARELKIVGSVHPLAFSHDAPHKTPFALFSARLGARLSINSSASLVSSFLLSMLLPWQNNPNCSSLEDGNMEEIWWIRLEKELFGAGGGHVSFEYKVLLH